MVPGSERHLQGRLGRSRHLLGFDTGRSSLPHTISVPNLIADRPDLVSFCRVGVDVRRLMYQSLICRLRGVENGGDHARRFTTPFYPQFFQCTADALVDRVGADTEAERNFLAAEMLVDEQEAVDLTLGQATNSRRILATFEGLVPRKAVCRQPHHLYLLTLQHRPADTRR